jgi:hypothetical protein
MLGRIRISLLTVYRPRQITTVNKALVYLSFKKVHQRNMWCDNYFKIMLKLEELAFWCL